MALKFRLNLMLMQGFSKGSLQKKLREKVWYFTKQGGGVPPDQTLKEKTGNWTKH